MTEQYMMAPTPGSLAQGLLHGHECAGWRVEHSTGCTGVAFGGLRLILIDETLRYAGAIIMRLLSPHLPDKMHEAMAVASGLERNAPGLLLIDRYHVLWANPAAEREIGMTLDVIASRTFWQLIHPDEVDRDHDEFERNVVQRVGVDECRTRWIHPLTKAVIPLTWTAASFSCGMVYACVHRTPATNCAAGTGEALEEAG